MAATSADEAASFERTGRTQPSASNDSALDAGLAHERPGPRGVAVAQERPHGQRVGLERAAHVLPVLGRDVPVDLAQVAPRAVEGVVGHGEALRLRAGEGVGHVDGDVGPGLVAPAPEAEAAVVVLQRAQAVDVALHRRLDLLGLRQALGLEGGEDVAERRHREDARGELLRALEGIGDEVEDGVGEGLERGRGGRDLEAAEVGHDAGRGLHGLDDAPVVDLAVGGEGLGGGRRPDGQLHLGRVGRVPRCGAHLDARLSRAHGGHREAHLRAVVRGHHEAAAGPGGERGVARADRDVHRHLGVGLVLHDDRQLEAVAEVQEARRGRAHHERQAGDERRLAGAEAPRALDGHGHHAVAGQAVGQLHRARAPGPRRRSGRWRRRARAPRSRCARGWARGPCPRPTSPCSASSAARPSPGPARPPSPRSRPAPASLVSSATPRRSASSSGRASRTCDRSRWSVTSAPRRA